MNITVYIDGKMGMTMAPCLKKEISKYILYVLFYYFSTGIIAYNSN